MASRWRVRWLVAAPLDSQTNLEASWPCGRATSCPVSWSPAKQPPGKLVGRGANHWLVGVAWRRCRALHVRRWTSDLQKKRVVLYVVFETKTISLLVRVLPIGLPLSTSDVFWEAHGRQYVPHVVIASHTTMLKGHHIFEDGIWFCTSLARYN